MPPSKVPVMVWGADRVVAPAAAGKTVVAAAETETALRTTETKRVVSCIFFYKFRLFCITGIRIGLEREAGIKARE